MMPVLQKSIALDLRPGNAGTAAETYKYLNSNAHV